MLRAATVEKCKVARDYLNKIVVDVTAYADSDYGTFQCSPSGFLKDNTNENKKCPASVAALNKGLEHFQSGVYTNCDYTTVTSTVTSSVSSTATTSMTSTASTSVSSTATTSASSTETTSATTTATTTASSTVSTTPSTTGTSPQWNGKGCIEPNDWVDSDGRSCKDYETNNFCADGAQAAGWPVFETFDAYSNRGFHAGTACCLCGSSGITTITTTATSSETSTALSTASTTVTTGIDGVYECHMYDGTPLVGSTGSCVAYTEVLNGMVGTCSPSTEADVVECANVDGTDVIVVPAETDRSLCEEVAEVVAVVEAVEDTVEEAVDDTDVEADVVAEVVAELVADVEADVVTDVDAEDVWVDVAVVCSHSKKVPSKYLSMAVFIRSTVS